MAGDGSDARPLVATDCVWPTANPGGQSFLCLGGEQQGTLLLYPLTGGPGRKLHELPAGGSFVYARWNASGKHILAVTRDWRLLTLNPVTGALVRTETISFLEAPATETLRSAALSPDAAIQAYSISHFSSRLYLGRGL